MPPAAAREPLEAPYRAASALLRCLSERERLEADKLAPLLNDKLQQHAITYAAELRCADVKATRHS